MSQVLCDPVLREEPLIVAAGAQMLAASVLAAFPHSVRTDATAQDRNDVDSLTLRRALAYIEGVPFLDRCGRSER
ncbi:hypothetical protein [Streptomyces sp. NPDC060205]|uniref:hypothetical protein n=1 Tax=Streptomyces sp. NPDC060205 TaxID=3347072 RepID=UPI00364DD7C3